MPTATRTKTRSNQALSIVGEKLLRQAQHEADIKWAAPEDVDNLVDSASDDVLACREEMRHKFPTHAELRGKPIDFIGVNNEGLLIRSPLLCKRCQLAYRHELYDIIGTGKNVRTVRVISFTRYKDGYLLKGKGRVTATMVRDSLSTKAMAGMTAAEIRKNAKLRQAEIEAAQKQAAKKHLEEVRAS